MKKRSKVTLCPLYGDIKIDWEKNLPLQKNMLEWPIFEYDQRDPKRLGLAEERSYQYILEALTVLPKFKSFVGLEADTKKERFIFWNAKFRVQFYMGKEKVIELLITRSEHGFWFHFNGLEKYVGPRKNNRSPVLDWQTKEWVEFFQARIKDHADLLLKEAGALSKKITTLNKFANNLNLRLSA